ncbi:ATP-dependent nuclease [Chryseobacterium polytrichastri]|uniref:AAA domain-containing protein, putative AbiEii toxin, Type IV TA system n=1 Tax=Chryseobacterium polytrichastri TaxID=1302687 RepID=A0A1M6TGW6_9FLAO|nr:AAA family ATPase [Chryseobacterium polytrichastri]SHK56144.1 AAA domain-containing protein, putative AbiEii toxin, Type IV TA system [Chryseobacterium polytrichastri]
MIIKSITLKNKSEINIGKISVLVGPNNVGKSQTLRDIQQTMDNGKMSQKILIDKITFETPTKFEDIFFNLKVTDSTNNIGYKVVRGIKNNLSQKDQYEFNWESMKQQLEREKNIDFTLGNISKFKVSFLDSSTRLNLVKTSTSFNPEKEEPSNLLQNLYIDNNNDKLLRDAFYNSFEMDIKLDYSGLRDFCLRVAKEFEEIPEDPRKAFPIFNKYNKIDNQGDGFRSFAGIILSLLFSKDRIILLDEPEAFLHPAQARFLGKWIADNSDNFTGQLLISTHNSNFLSGLLQSDKKVDIYRLNRVDDNTSFNLIPSEATENLSKSPMLSSQRILEAIFHKGVIVCEADADRIVYQSVSTLLFNNQEVLFVHSHNKQTLKDVAKLLKDTKIPVGVICDIDLLNDETDFKNLILSVTNNTVSEALTIKRREIADSINNSNEEELLKNIQEKIIEFQEQLKNGEHRLGGAIGAINRIRKETSKWSIPKSNGINGFEESIQTTVISLIHELNELNIFLVPVGELEGWIDVGTKRKNKWIIKALDSIFAGQTPDNLRDFVGLAINKVKNNIT